MNTKHVVTSAAGFALITVVMVAPFVDYHDLSSASYEGDSRLIIWTLAWDAHALLTGSSLFDANMFHPATEALAWAEHHFGIALFATRTWQSPRFTNDWRRCLPGRFYPFRPMPVHPPRSANQITYCSQPPTGGRS